MKKYLIILCVILAISACKKKSKSIDGPKVQIPIAAILTLPASNSVCLTGTVVSDAVVKINFIWQNAANTQSYEMVLKNLLTQAETKNTVSSTQLELDLDRNTPYSWYVVSKSNTTVETAKSESRKFYTEGIATINYAPFPASNLIPQNAAIITAIAGKINLSWLGEDADNDIKDYDIYLGTAANNLVKIQSNYATNSLTNVSVNARTSYFWKIVVRDQKGNTSESPINTFSIN